MNSETLISVVVPAYNEQEVLPEFHRRTTAVLRALSCQWEIIYVNDGSTDATLLVLDQLRKADEHVAIVDLSRNFGKEIALTAGLDHAAGDAVIVIDADLQDPPELIPELIRVWQEGADVVYAKRRVRRGESVMKRTTAYLFYRVMQNVSRVQLPEDTGDFRLLSRRAVEALKLLREQHRFMKGLFTWIGYKQVAVPYDRDARFAGKTKWNYWRLWNFALEGITSFTIAPLRIATYLGLITAAGAFAYGAFIVVRTLLYGNPVAGYPSLLTTILFLGGVQLTAIGILGEYVGRIFNETKNRPLYFVNRYEAARQVALPHTEESEGARSREPQSSNLAGKATAVEQERC
nr:glycosyl transferase family 2 [Gammaproteobacteria bacterium]